jgi:hypothetical protein
MKMKKLIVSMIGMAVILCAQTFIFMTDSLLAQEVTGPHKIKWLRVGNLHNWYSNAGAEVEYGRRGRASFQADDQTDQLNWEAQYAMQDRCCSKGMWIGTTNYDDPIVNKTFTCKVVQAGPRFANTLTNFMPVVFKMVGQFAHPSVVVDGANASENDVNDIVDEYDANLKADRMVITKLISNIGVEITRKVYAFSQQYHSDYFIYDYVFKNTGVIDLQATTATKTLTDFRVLFEFRNAPGWEAGQTFGAGGGTTWGFNTLNDVIGQDPNAPDFRFRAFYSYWGPFSGAPDYDSDWGAPNYRNGTHLGAPAFVGAVTIHADKSPTDPSDDLSQPSSTQYVGSDQTINSAYDSFNRDAMIQQYALMSAGHPAKTHAQEVGDGFANLWSTDPGGISQSISYGPYNLNPGDSIHIVYAEAVAGLRRAKSEEVGKNWYQYYAGTGAPPLKMPDNTTTNDAKAYKKVWVWTARDSLLLAFQRAIDNYNSNFSIPQPPPPPKQFIVNSGGDRILLSWADNAMSWPNFDGYEIYRAVGKPDTSYEKIFSCDKANVVHNYDDVSAVRGFDYYYYIQTKDDGSTNDIKPGVPLVSSKFYTMTNQPARLQRPAENNLAEIRVVPNPFNIRAASLQFGSTTPDRIAFYGLPPECVIKIYTERGDLVDTIHHIDGSGDELWDSVTSSRQIVVSGLYVAYFEVTKDVDDPQSGKRLLSRGDNTFRKFIIIR